MSVRIVKSLGAVFLAVAMVSGGVSAAHADGVLNSPPTEPGGASSASFFDSAQQAIGLSSDDASRLDSGVAVTSSTDFATTTLGDFAVTVSANGNTSDVTVLADGARIMSLVQEGESSTSFSVALPANASLEPDGAGFRIIGSVGGTKLILGEVLRPWAVDADGRQLATSYALSGSTLTQNISTDGAKYPIVADPTVTVGGSDGSGLYWNMTGAQAKALGAATTLVVGLSLAGGCIAAAKIPRVGFLIQGLCGFVGIPGLKSIFSSVASILNNTSVQSGSCYQLKVVPQGKSLKKTSASNCA
jgi:hypothetical protein